MKTIQTIAQRLHKTAQANANTEVQCNFADDYYGDRVCVLPVKSTNTK